MPSVFEIIGQNATGDIACALGEALPGGVTVGGITVIGWISDSAFVSIFGSGPDDANIANTPTFERRLMAMRLRELADRWDPVCGS